MFDRYDVWLTPTTPRVAEPRGLYHLGRTDLEIDDVPEALLRPVCQDALSHNIVRSATPSISLRVNPS